MERIHNLIIVDESGSMEVIRKQAFAGMNETLQTIRKMQEKFPEQEQFVTHHLALRQHAGLPYRRPGLERLSSRRLHASLRRHRQGHLEG